MMTPPTIAAGLHATIDEALKLFAGVDERRTTVRPDTGTWCAREVLGHLIDSACNNHRRFVVAQAGDLARFDGYDQNAWVARQRYREVPWRDLVALWTAYNRHLAHVIAVTPPRGARLHRRRLPTARRRSRSASSWRITSSTSATTWDSCSSLLAA